jgi:hypothetical protein
MVMASNMLKSCLLRMIHPGLPYCTQGSTIRMWKNFGEEFGSILKSEEQLQYADAFRDLLGDTRLAGHVIDSGRRVHYGVHYCVSDY